MIGERAPEAANPKLMQPLLPNRMQVIYADFLPDYAKTNVNYYYDMAVMERGERVIGRRPV